MKKIIATLLLASSLTAQAYVSPTEFKRAFKEEQLVYYGHSDYRAFTIEIGAYKLIKPYQAERIFEKVCQFLRQNRENNFSKIEIQVEDGSFWEASFNKADCKPHFIRYD